MTPQDRDLFEQVITIEDPQYSYVDKVNAMPLSPYNRTLFLDTDTYVYASLEHLFVLLDRFELAAAHDPWRYGYNLGCPEGFSRVQ